MIVVNMFSYYLCIHSCSNHLMSHYVLTNFHSALLSLYLLSLHASYHNTQLLQSPWFMMSFLPNLKLPAFHRSTRQEVSRQLTSMSLTNKGLLNPKGHNNCFLNSCVQVYTFIIIILHVEAHTLYVLYTYMHIQVLYVYI